MPRTPVPVIIASGVGPYAYEIRAVATSPTEYTASVIAFTRKEGAREVVFPVEHFPIGIGETIDEAAQIPESVVRAQIYNSLPEIRTNVI